MLDFIGIIVLIIFFIRGYMKGIIVAVFSFLAIIIGIVCSLELSGKLAVWLFEKGWVTNGWGQVISYAILFFIVMLVVRFIARAIEGTIKLAMLGWMNGLIGGLAYSFLGTIIWSSILWIGTQMHLLSPETLVYSKTYSYFEPLAPWAFDQIGRLLPFAKDVFSDLQHFFDNVNTKLPDHVGAY